MATATSTLGQIEVQGNGTGASFMTFHRPGVFAAYIGIDTDNVWKVGGWSMGAVAYKLWHEGSDGAGSGLDADLLDGFQSSQTNTASTVAVRDGSGDITTRLFKSTYPNGADAGITGFIGRISSDGTGDTFLRPQSIAQTKTLLGVGTMASRSLTISTGAPTGGVDGDVWFKI
jgi:hypothetical protein